MVNLPTAVRLTFGAEKQQDRTIDVLLKDRLGRIVARKNAADAFAAARIKNDAMRVFGAAQWRSVEEWSPLATFRQSAHGASYAYVLADLASNGWHIMRGQPL